MRKIEYFTAKHSTWNSILYKLYFATYLSQPLHIPWDILLSPYLATILVTNLTLWHTCHKPYLVTLFVTTVPCNILVTVLTLRHRPYLVTYLSVFTLQHTCQNSTLWHTCNRLDLATYLSQTLPCNILVTNFTSWHTCHSSYLATYLSQTLRKMKKHSSLGV